MHKQKLQRFSIKSRKAQVGIGIGVIVVLIIGFSVIGVVSSRSIFRPAPVRQATALSLTPVSQTTALSLTPVSQATSTSSSSPASKTNYVTLSGQSFAYKNMRIYAYGATMYPYWNYNGTIYRGSGWAHPAFKGYIDQIISLAQQAHLNTIRPTNYFDGIAFGDWYNATVWTNMDYLLQAAASHNMHVILDLSSFRDKTLKQGIYPYEPSLYKAAFSWVAARYASNPAILYYAIAGEVKCPTGHDPLRPASTQALTNYYQVLSNTLYAADPHHLISTGGLSFLNEPKCGIDWQTIFSLPHIDIAAIHVYSANDRNITLPLVSQWAVSKLKQFTVEEFGFQQVIGDTTRSADFQNMYNLGKQYNVTAMVFWNLGPEISSSSYEVNPSTPSTWNTVIQNAP
jgi:cellulase (glycosyl hydrolase family 5)